MSTEATQHEINKNAQLFDLQRLLAPVTVDQYLSVYWGQRPLFVAGWAEKFTGLFDEVRFRAAVENASARNMHGSFRLAALAFDPELGLSFGEIIRPDEIDAALAEGLTLCVNDISAGDSELHQLALAVKRQLGHVGRVRFNGYLSPDGSGASLHFDARVAMTLQLAGEKRWRFGSSPSVAWPRSNAQMHARGHVAWMSPGTGTRGWEQVPPVDEASLEEVVLRPGDVLCLPAGTWHTAQAIGHSLALNLACEPMRFAELLGMLFDEGFMDNADWRGGVVPAGLPVDGPLPEAQRCFLQARIGETKRFLEGLERDDAPLQQLWRKLCSRH
jgi:ribosomal protein L16 Arg81 hydroxylase